MAYLMQIPTPAQPSKPLQALGSDLTTQAIDAKKLLPCLQSVNLFNGQKSITIEHNGAMYRLQTTKLGKLILTK
jgi:hemin uptake protein HemP